MRWPEDTHNGPREGLLPFRIPSLSNRALLCALLRGLLQFQDYVINTGCHFNILLWHLTVKIKSSLGEKQGRFNETKFKHLERMRPSRAGPSTRETAQQEGCVGCHPVAPY